MSRNTIPQQFEICFSSPPTPPSLSLSLSLFLSYPRHCLLHASVAAFFYHLAFRASLQGRSREGAGEIDSEGRGSGDQMSQDEDETRNATGYAPVGYPHPQYPPQAPPPPPPPQQQAYGFPYQGYTNPYNPSAPPPGTPYYASPQLPVLHPESNKGYACARVALVFMITFVIGSLALAVFMGLVFGSGAPEFKIEAFSVPYFNVITGNSTLQASWDANITAKNPSRKLEFFLAEIEGSLVYRGSTVDLTLIDPLHLGISGEGRMQANFSVYGADDGDAPGPPEGVVRQMVEDRKSGSAEFDLRIAMEATFSSVNTFWRSTSVLRVNCADIRVNFPSPTGGGNWDGASGECLTFA